MTRDEILAVECPTCGAWRTHPCKSQNRAYGNVPVLPSLKPTSRPHKARVALALKKLDAAKRGRHLYAV